MKTDKKHIRYMQFYDTQRIFSVFVFLFTDFCKCHEFGCMLVRLTTRRQVRGDRANEGHDRAPARTRPTPPCDFYGRKEGRGRAGIFELLPTCFFHSIFDSSLHRKRTFSNFFHRFSQLTGGIRSEKNIEQKELPQNSAEFSKNFFLSR